MDELREESPNIQNRLLTLIKQISSTTSARGAVVCKVLISSRRSQTLLQALRKKPKVSLTEEKQCFTRSIEEYASQRLREVNRKFEQLGIGSEQIEGIVRQISAKADSKAPQQTIPTLHSVLLGLLIVCGWSVMFLYARLVLDYLRSGIFVNGTELKDSIHELPKRLSNLYVFQV